MSDAAAETADESDAGDDAPFWERHDHHGPLSLSADVAVVESFVDRLLPICSEAVLTPFPEGIRARAVNPANTAMVDATLSADALDTYAAAAEICVDLTKLSDVLDYVDGTVVVDVDADRAVAVVTDDEETVEFELGLINPDNARRRPDELIDGQCAAATVGADRFEESIDAVDMVADHLRVGVGGGSVTVVGDGDIDSVSYEFRGAVDEGPEDSVSSLFSHELIETVVDPLEGSLSLSVDDDFPILIGSETEAVESTHLIAPRIEAD